MPNVSNEERLAVITAFGKAVKQAEKQVREEVDAQMRDDFMAYGVTQKQLTVNGQKVGTISARMSKPKVGHFPSIANAQEFVEWLRTSDGGLDTLNRLVTVKPDLVLEAAVADGELPDGCEMVERFEPPMMTGTTVRVQLPKVVEALGNNLGAAAAALLTGEVE